MTKQDALRRPAARSRRAFWLRHLHQWHWISAAICLIGTLLFAATGITLNHAAQIEARPQVTERQAGLPDDLRTQVAEQPATGKAPLPPAVAHFLTTRFGVRLDGSATEWSANEVYVSLPRPGGDAWLSIDRDSGEVTYEVTDRGWASYLNDLHKGRNTGEAWRWFIDAFAAGCVVFCVTGLFLLHLHGRHRPATWPLVGAGLAIPALLAVAFMH